MMSSGAAKVFVVRILLVTPPWLLVPPVAYGGIEWVVSGLADGLVAAGHDVTLVAPGGSSTRARLEAIFDEPMFEQLGDARIETVQALSAYRLRREYDVIHDHTAAVGPALATLIDGPPVINTLHRVWDDLQVALARLISPPVRLVAISHDQARRAPQDISITAVVHNGIPIERYPYIAEKGDYLLWVGRASPDKGLETAIDVARRVGRRLVVAIKVNERDEHVYWEEVLDPLIKSSPISIDVFFNPEHERKAELMGGAAVLVMPIQWAEPFGLVIPEANACGTPVIAFAVGAAPEVIDDGTTGFLVPPGDVDGFCEAIDRAADISPHVCRKHVIGLFSAQRMVSDYERVYEALATVDLRTQITVVL